MNELRDKLLKWYINGDNKMREQVRLYIFNLEHLTYKEQNEIWQYIINGSFGKRKGLDVK